MQNDARLIEAEAFDRLVEHDLGAADREARRGHGVGDVARRDRAVELAAFAGLPDDDDVDAFELTRNLFGLSLLREVLRLELGALLFEESEIVLGRAQRLFLRQQKISCKTRAYFHHLAHLAKIFDALQQDEFDHGRPLLDRGGQEPEEAGPLDRLRQLALLLGRHGCDAARHDLAALGDIALEQLHVLVIDFRRVRTGEWTGFAPPEERPATAAATAAAAAIAAIAPTETTPVAAAEAATIPIAKARVAHRSAPSLPAIAAGGASASRSRRGPRSRSP